MGPHQIRQLSGQTSIHRRADPEPTRSGVAAEREPSAGAQRTGVLPSGRAWTTGACERTVDIARPAHSPVRAAAARWPTVIVWICGIS